MYLMYVDESGDPGKYSGKNSRHYILSGLIIPENNWKETLERIKQFRKYLKETYGFKYRLELHSSELIRINKIKDYRQISKKKRIEIYKQHIQNMPSIFSTGKIINICFDKKEESNLNEFQTVCWNRLINRYDAFLKKSNNSKGIIVCDDSDEPLLRNLMRKMRIYNPIPSHYGNSYYQSPINNILEDIFHRDSRHSYFIQAVDAIAHVLYRREYPKGSLKKHGIERWFNFLEPLLIKEASNSDELGIVRK